VEGETNLIASLFPLSTHLQSSARYTMPIQSTWEWKKVSTDWDKYNRAHPCLPRLDNECFVLRMLDDPAVIPAKTVQLYALHNMVLYNASVRREFNPYGYEEFARLVHTNDAASGFG
jgi:hypothetical protein